MELTNRSNASLTHLKAKIRLVQGFLVVSAVILILLRPYLLAKIRDHHLPPDWLIAWSAAIIILFVAIGLLQVRFFFGRIISLSDCLPFLFGLFVVAIVLSSAIQEYRVLKLPNTFDLTLAQTFVKHRDARLRALAILSLARHNFDEEIVFSLINQGLLDKDELVQEAAKLVIESNMAVTLRNGKEGIRQAFELMESVMLKTLVVYKGMP